MKKFFLNISIAFLFIMYTNISLAKEHYSLVLFYADWNVYSNKAINTLKEVATSYNNVTFEKINMDDEKAFVRMKQLGVMPTNTIPYYFLIDNDKKVLYGSNYKNESTKVIIDNIHKEIENN